MAYPNALTKLFERQAAIFPQFSDSIAHTEIVQRQQFLCDDGTCTFSCCENCTDAVHFQAMKLSEFMKANDLDDAAMAQLIGVNRVSVSRYRRGKAIPDKNVMPRIAPATDGLVTANDFYQIDPPEAA